MRHILIFLVLFLLVPSTAVFSYHEEATSSKQTGACEYYLQHPDDLHNMCQYKRSCEGLEYDDADRKSVLEEDYLIQLFLQNNPWASLQRLGAIGNFDIENPWRVGSQNYNQDRNMVVSLNTCSDITSISYQDLSLHILGKDDGGKALLYVSGTGIHDPVQVAEGKYEIAKRIIDKHLSPKVQVDEFGIPSNKIHCNNDLVLVQKYDGSPACVTSDTKTKLIEREWIHPCPNVMFSEPRSLCITGSPGIGSDSELESEPELIPDSESLQQQKKQQEKIRIQEIVLADTRGTENKINAIKEYRDEFETGYFLEQFVHIFQENYEKDRLMHFVYGEWGYQPTENTSAEVAAYFRSYDNYDMIEKINEWQKPKDSAILMSPDSDGYFVIDLHGMSPAIGIHETCVIPGEYRISATTPDDESKVVWGYFTCQKDKLVGEPQPWMDLPE